MAQNLSALIRRRPAPVRADTARIDSRTPLSVELPLFAPEPWLRESDVRDALMTFALTFTGAVIFLL